MGEATNCRWKNALYDRKMFVWKGYENRIISMSSLLDPRDGLTFIYHLLGLFYDSSIETRTKRNSSPEKAKETERERRRTEQTAGEKKNVASPETLFSFCFFHFQQIPQ